jgi:hypothetical protein
VEDLEVVVSRCGEDLRWTGNVPAGVRVTVYDKGGGGAGIPLPNVGREAHTYLHHLVERYDSLAETTVFCQGHPFDHCHDLHDTLRALARGERKVDGFLWLGFILDTDDARGRRLHVPWGKNPEGRELDIAGCYQAVLGAPAAEWFRFVVGGQFAVARECARRRPREFYEKARDYAAAQAEASFCLERFWDRVFGVEYVTEQLLPRGEMTRYLKRIKKL